MKYSSLGQLLCKLTALPVQAHEAVGGAQQRAAALRQLRAGLARKAELPPQVRGVRVRCRAARHQPLCLQGQGIVEYGATVWLAAYALTPTRRCTDALWYGLSRSVSRSSDNRLASQPGHAKGVDHGGARLQA